LLLLLMVMFLIKGKKKNLLIVALPLVVILFIITGGIIFSQDASSIWVNGALEGDNSFSFAIKNHKILATGSTYTFKVINTKEDLFNKIKQEYPNAIMHEDIINIFNKNQFYTITFLEKNGNKNKFILTSEHVIYTESTDSYNLPFPVKKVVGDDILVGNSFNISCDLSYLKNYYKDFDNVTISNNNIIIALDKIITLCINDNNVAITVS